ncbi:hypothetical protein Desaci_0439 [Desulfosporosinus acidiphilus SJ4]|uniref:DUF3786 domain-containing protein n=1 Tax=Desulfosporosinus acidiphilus (strain DSM 22704 / JCM 16185 / SJ4) TaxID=646529 RepID=I4D132_DESAJ|nr:DUF3786 domain-containing protein [Desulfosporosinus acidiphilus]AFM39506.1 hypothetical protein Desaci_0439 [Desulfosporosinus acidiphilus SJ4]
METNYRIAYDKYWQDIKEKQAEEITKNRAVSYNSQCHQFEVSFFNSEYVLDCPAEKIYRKSDGHSLDIMGSIIMLNYLAYARPLQRSIHKWISLKEIPNGGALFYPAFHKNSIIPLVKAFGVQSQELYRVAATMGGRQADLGDAAVIFQVFPEISMCVVVWEGDEEVRGNATILYEPGVDELLHIESVIGLGSYISEKLVRRSVSSL